MSRDIHVVSININGVSQLLQANHQSAMSAYKKKPIESERVFLGMDGFEGDSVHDKKHHGGNHKAVCCYNLDRVEYWKNNLGIDTGLISPFGENLSLAGVEANEENIFIGDRYSLGESIVEVSEPRGPCYMIGIRHNYKAFALKCQQVGYTGFYLRTIKPGVVKKGDLLKHLYSAPEKISVMHINQIRYNQPSNKEELRRIYALEKLTPEWRDKIKLLIEKA